MPSPVRVFIEGLALCYRKGNDWVVLFVCDPKHPLMLTLPNEAKPIQLREEQLPEEEERDLECRFIGNTAGGNIGGRPGNLFNLNGQDAHDGRLRRLRRNQMDTQVIEMTLPHADLSVLSSSKPEYFIQEVGAETRPRQIGPVAETIMAEFTLQSGPLTFRVGNKDRKPHEIGYMDMDHTLTFHFNNHCGGECRRNDSIDLYDVMIDDVEGKERRFVTGILKDGNVPGHQSIDFKFDEKDESKSGPYGNCDPMWTDPPIG